MYGLHSMRIQKQTYYGLTEQAGPWSLTSKDKQRLKEKDPLWLGGGNPAGGRKHAGHANWLVAVSYPTLSDNTQIGLAQFKSYPSVTTRGNTVYDKLPYLSDRQERRNFNRGIFGQPSTDTGFLPGTGAQAPGFNQRPPGAPGIMPGPALPPGANMQDFSGQTPGGGPGVDQGAQTNPPAPPPVTGSMGTQSVVQSAGVQTQTRGLGESGPSDSFPDLTAFWTQYENDGETVDMGTMTVDNGVVQSFRDMGVQVDPEELYLENGRITLQTQTPSGGSMVEGGTQTESTMTAEGSTQTRTPLSLNQIRQARQARQPRRPTTVEWGTQTDQPPDGGGGGGSRRSSSSSDSSDGQGPSGAAGAGAVSQMDWVNTAMNNNGPWVAQFAAVTTLNNLLSAGITRERATDIATAVYNNAINLSGSAVSGIGALAEASVNTIAAGLRGATPHAVTLSTAIGSFIGDNLMAATRGFTASAAYSGGGMIGLVEVARDASRIGYRQVGGLARGVVRLNAMALQQLRWGLQDMANRAANDPGLITYISQRDRRDSGFQESAGTQANVPSVVPNPPVRRSARLQGQQVDYSGMDVNSEGSAYATESQVSSHGTVIPQGRVRNLETRYTQPVGAPRNPNAAYRGPGNATQNTVTPGPVNQANDVSIVSEMSYQSVSSSVQRGGVPVIPVGGGDAANILNEDEVRRMVELAQRNPLADPLTRMEVEAQQQANAMKKSGGGGGRPRFGQAPPTPEPSQASSSRSIQRPPVQAPLSAPPTEASSSRAGARRRSSEASSQRTVRQRRQ